MGCYHVIAPEDETTYSSGRVLCGMWYAWTLVWNPICTSAGNPIRTQFRGDGRMDYSGISIRCDAWNWKCSSGGIDYTALQIVEEIIKGTEAVSIYSLTSVPDFM